MIPLSRTTFIGTCTDQMNPNRSTSSTSLGSYLGVAGTPAHLGDRNTALGAGPDTGQATRPRLRGPQGSLRPYQPRPATDAHQRPRGGSDVRRKSRHVRDEPLAAISDQDKHLGFPQPTLHNHLARDHPHGRVTGGRVTLDDARSVRDEPEPDISHRRRLPHRRNSRRGHRLTTRVIRVTPFGSNRNPANPIGVVIRQQQTHLHTTTSIKMLVPRLHDPNSSRTSRHHDNLRTNTAINMELRAATHHRANTNQCQHGPNGTNSTARQEGFLRGRQNGGTVPIGAPQPQ